MFQFYASEGSKSGEKAADIERYRARHRRLCRGQIPDATSPQVEDLDVEDGRTRKISAKWRQQQQQQHQVPVSNQFDEANWTATAGGSDIHVGFNAFDFSASPEAFGVTRETVESKVPSSQDNQQDGEDVEKAGRLWERRFQDGGQSETAKQLPTLSQDALWGGPVHYATQDAQRRALYYQPQYFA